MCQQNCLTDEYGNIEDHVWGDIKEQKEKFSISSVCVGDVIRFYYQQCKKCGLIRKIE
jgi:hypothetical protein